MSIPSNDELMHYGVKRRSGRYPWGSGKEPYQHSGDFLSRVEELTKGGLSESDLAKEMGMTTTDLRMQLRRAKHERKNLDADRARSLREDGKSFREIAAIMGYKNESSIRSLLNTESTERRNKAETTADILREELKNKKMLDVGAGVERELGVSEGTLKEAVFILETEGYNRFGVGIQQVNNKGKQINTTILARPDIEPKYAYDHYDEIESIRTYRSNDGGKTFDKLEYPSSIDSKRVGIRYAEEGGIDRDGTIEIRRGVKDLSLGNSHYAQVRIMVDGTHYLKGMAMYSDDLPDGVDIMFNTNKKKGTDKADVFKAIKTDDPNNPFGSYITAKGQSHYIDENGKRQLSPINKLKEEGDWDDMSKTLSSQFLSKQPLQLIQRQLNLTYDDAKMEYESISSLTNPTVKRKMLADFADECDGAVVHLKAAALPRQKVQVILPIPSLKDNEIYAPNFNNGETVSLVRFPHGGTFEIPQLVVNNKHKDARRILGTDIRDAVGINMKVAERLSGADFDGDQVMVIPTNDKVRIKSTPPLKGLENFDAKEKYGPDSYASKKNVTLMTKGSVQKQMGMVSNLITDMTLRGASDEDLARAVRHSMVVIDAYKHKLDYKQSEKDNGIAELKTKYQGYVNDEGKYVSGASTLLSRRKQTVQVNERKGSGTIDPETGKVSYKESGRSYIDKKTGKEVMAKTDVKLLNYVDDVRTLSSGTAQENAYAVYANKMKALANQARKEYLATGRLAMNSEAKARYKEEVETLDAKLNVALMNAPRERKAQAIANSKIKALQQDNPDIDKKELKKISQQIIYDARNEVGASGRDTRIDITDREWEAIQAGAISDNKLTQILRYADDQVVREKATPREAKTISTAKMNKIKAMSANGYTNAEIANVLKLSTSTIAKYLN